MITKAPGAKQGWALVTFELPSSTWAERVNLATAGQWPSSCRSVLSLPLPGGRTAMAQRVARRRLGRQLIWLGRFCGGPDMLRSGATHFSSALHLDRREGE